jgi:PPIC-type PPIASE domain
VAVVALTLGGMAGCGGAGSGSVVAGVGGETIGGSTLAHWVSAAGVGGAGRVDRSGVLSGLISLHWALGEAREYGVRVSAGEVANVLGMLKYARMVGTRLGLFAGEAEVQRLLAGGGLSRADEVWLVEAHVLMARVRQRLDREGEGMVGRAEVAAFYRANRRRFVVPERRDIAIFMTRDLGSAERGRREVLAGRSFVEVARRRNVSPETHHGLIMGLVRGSGEPPLERHVFGAKPGVVRGPVHQVFYYVFKVTKVVPTHVASLAQEEAAIRARLGAREAGGVLLVALERRWAARTSCRAGFVVALCRER